MEIVLCAFIFYVDYSVYIIEVTSFRFLVFQLSLDAKIEIRNLLVDLNKGFSKNKKRKKYGRGADISLPHCLATGIGNLAPKRSPGRNLEELC